MADGFRIRRCEFGRGLFATRNFQKGDEILCFTGRPLTYEGTLAKGMLEGNALQIGKNRYIDTEAPGLFVNHSCNPNAGVCGVRLVAARKISRGEEIFFDYSTTMSGDTWTMICLCGQPGCRGVIRDFSFLPPEVQQQRISQGMVADFVIAEMAVPVLAAR